MTPILDARETEKLADAEGCADTLPVTNAVRRTSTVALYWQCLGDETTRVQAAVFHVGYIAKALAVVLGSPGMANTLEVNSIFGPGNARCRYGQSSRCPEGYRRRNQA